MLKIGCLNNANDIQWNKVPASETGEEISDITAEMVQAALIRNNIVQPNIVLTVGYKDDAGDFITMLPINQVPASCFEGGVATVFWKFARAPAAPPSLTLPPPAVQAPCAGRQTHFWPSGTKGKKRRLELSWWDCLGLAMLDAAKKGCHRCVKDYIDDGYVHANFRSPDTGYTAISWADYALQHNDISQEQRDEVVRVLLERGAHE